MALSAGRRLGPYEILEPLGAGGMGEVYRARDTRLDRTVALKVLPEGFAADPRLKARFEREARAISALAHPHICTLFDVGEQDGQAFLVMEHLVGQTLAQRLQKGPLPLDKALEVATQIADALAAAHKQGIVHRDLKPGNVMLTKTGARLLDFGLARLTAHGERPAVESLTSAPTEAQPLTRAGTVMGTLPYMAPEQVEGRAADARTDLWALGVVLYEMVAGTRAFEASTPTSLVGAILEREPTPLAERQPLTPPSLDRLVRRCLTKDPDDRWDTAHDVADELRWIAEASSEAGAQERGPWTQRSMTAALVVVAVAALLAGVLVGRLWPPPSEGSGSTSVIRSHIDLTPERALRREEGLFRSHARELALSTDGTLLVWSGGPGSDPARSALYLRQLESGEVRQIPGTEGAFQPFFSPDGRWIGFLSNGWLRKVPVDGGLTVDLAEVGFGSIEGTSWAPDGRIFLGIGPGISWVPADGGPPRSLTTVDVTRENDHGYPAVLPGGRALLVAAEANFAVRRVEALSLATGARKILVEDGADARYLPTGHLVFVRRGVLMAAPFDADRLELKAPPVPVVDDVLQSVGSARDRGSRLAQLTASGSGLLVYASGGVFEDPPGELLLVDESGRAEPLPGFDRPLVSPQVRLSPDGRQLASVDRAGSGVLWLFDVERHTFSPLSHEGVAASPSWSPDGARLAFAWSKVGPLDLWTLPVDDKGDWERLTEGEGPNWAPSWSPDGRVLAFVRGMMSPGLGDILLYRFEDRQVVPFLTTRAHETHPEFSPDGRWLAYASDESGRQEVYVTSFPDRKQTLTVSRDGGRSPAWSRDGRSLYYYSLESPDGGRSMMAVDVGLGASLSLGPPRALFRLPDGVLSTNPMRGFELHPDGRRFIVGRLPTPDPPPPVTRLHVVHNWFTQLERLAPTR